MNRERLGILVMLNNYLHDLAVGVLFSSMLTSWLLGRRLAGASAERRRFTAELVGDLARVTKVSLVWIVLGGAVRAVAYRDYEWQSAAGNGQVPALVLKHAVLAATVAAGLALQLDLRRRLRREGYHRRDRRDRRVITYLQSLRPLRALRWIRGPSAYPKAGESKSVPRAADEAR